MYHVMLQEADDTWTPFASRKLLNEALAYAEKKGISYKIQTIALGGKITEHANRDTGKRVVR